MPLAPITKILKPNKDRISATLRTVLLIARSSCVKVFSSMLLEWWGLLLVGSGAVLGVGVVVFEV